MKNSFLTLIIVLMGMACTKETTTNEKDFTNHQFSGSYEGVTYCDFGTRGKATIRIHDLSGNIVHLQLNSSCENIIDGYVDQNQLTIIQQSFKSGGGEQVVSGSGILRGNSLNLELEITNYNKKSLCHYECNKYYLDLNL